jgi:hypothetical protein
VVTRHTADLCCVAIGLAGIDSDTLLLKRCTLAAVQVIVYIEREET